MTCKDAINSDETQRKSVEEKRYPLSENKRYNKNFKSDLEGTNDQKCLRSSGVYPISICILDFL